MSQWFLVVLVSIGLFFGYQHYQDSQIDPLYRSPYLVVYGRDSCGVTQQTMRELEAAGVSFEFQSVDDQQVADQLHARMDSSGIDTRRYLLPVVDLNNHLETRPDNAKLISGARALAL